jgi:hypothetical protein
VPSLIHPAVTDVASGEKLIFTTSKSIYRVEHNNSVVKLFSQEALRTSNLSSYGSTLLFDVYSDNDTLLTDGLTFKLEEQPATDSATVLSLLPLSGKNLPVMSAVFAKNMLQIQPETFYTSDRATGTLSYDQAEYDKNRSVIIDYINQLKSTGKLPSDLMILFTQ